MKRPVSIRDKLASKPSEFSDAWRAVSAEPSICASCDEILPPPAFWAKFHFRLPFEVKFTAAISFDEILPSLDFP